MIGVCQHVLLCGGAALMHVSSFVEVLWDLLIRAAGYSVMCCKSSSCGCV